MERGLHGNSRRFTEIEKGNFYPFIRDNPFNPFNPYSIKMYFLQMGNSLRSLYKIPVRSSTRLNNEQENKPDLRKSRDN